MSNSRQRPHLSDATKTTSWPKKMQLSLAHKFLGVGHAKLTRLVNTGVIPYERDPLDHRVKLIKKSDLEKFKRKRERR